MSIIFNGRIVPSRRPCHHRSSSATCTVVLPSWSYQASLHVLSWEQWYFVEDCHFIYCLLELMCRNKSHREQIYNLKEAAGVCSLPSSIAIMAWKSLIFSVFIPGNLAQIWETVISPNWLTDNHFARAVCPSGLKHKIFLNLEKCW